MHRGFILQPTYRIESGRPVVLLWGKLESGGTFLIRDDRQVPGFWVRGADAERARELGAAVREGKESRVTLRGEPLVRIDVARPQDTPPLRDRLMAARVPCYEADVLFAYRYLMDRGIRGCVAIQGTPRSSPEAALFVNPEVDPSDWGPDLSVLSFDIETDPDARQLLSIAIVGCGASEVLLLTPQGSVCPPGAIPCRNERELLEAFVRRVRELDPDVLTGWNVVDFDIAVLLRMCGRLGVPLRLGRDREPIRLRRSPFPRGTNRAVASGRVVLDGIDLLRGAFVRMESYALNAVAREVLGRGKTIGGPDRAEEILEAFHTDRAGLVEYNLNDARLVLDILDEFRLVELGVGELNPMLLTIWEIQRRLSAL